MLEYVFFFLFSISIIYLYLIKYMLLVLSHLSSYVVCPNQRLAVAPFLELKKSKRSFRTREALYFQ